MFRAVRYPTDVMTSSSTGSPENALYDAAVVGGGIVGLATAMALSRRHGLTVAVLEAEDRVAQHQTGHNSGVIHSGLYYKPGSLKAKLCTEGRDAMYAFCAEHNVPHDRCGKVVVATQESELPALAELERRGIANGLHPVKLTAEGIKEHEPNITGIAGLFVGETGIVKYTAVAEAYAKVIREAGGQVVTGARANKVHASDGPLVLETARGEVRARHLVNCGGLESDRVARLCGVEPGVRIVPFRGEYYKLTQSSEHLVRNLVYPVPDPRFPFLGVHFTRMIEGGVEAGPNAVLSLARKGYHRLSFNPRDALEIATFGGTWRMARKYWKTGFGEMYRSFSKRAFLKALQKLLPALTMNDLHRGGAGVRAQAMEPNGAMVDDFRIIESDRMVHVLNAPSPAATASISIGKYIAEAAARSWNLAARN
jgi:(S)-2-hydroxyglutarate dehydrogenase